MMSKEYSANIKEAESEYRTIIDEYSDGNY